MTNVRNRQSDLRTILSRQVALPIVLASLSVCAPTQNVKGRQETATTIASNQAKAVIYVLVVDHTGYRVANFPVEARPVSQAKLQNVERMVFPLSARTNHEGWFSFELPLGEYEICVPRFPKSCKTVRLTEEGIVKGNLELKINPSDDHVSPELLDERIRGITGSMAQFCGRVKTTMETREDPSHANKCARRAVKQRKAFYVVYDEWGLDSWGAHALAGDSKGRVYYVGFDDMGMSTEHLPPGAMMPDGFHTIIIPCSLPVRLEKTDEGHLSCRWPRE